VHKVDVLAGAFILLRRKTLNEIGLLDEDFFMYGEDIDLSYRVVKGGYSNYYFPGSSIIHYKGESTKKSSINYVFVFYRAMVIFARKHLPGKTASAFAFFINLAIFLRAGAAILMRFLRRLFIPLVDFALIYALMTGLVIYWERTVTYHGTYGTNGYPPVLFRFFVPAYVVVWIFGFFISSAYQKPYRYRRILRGAFIGTVIIAVGYAFLPEHYRFSRAFILLGGAMALIGGIITRTLYNFIREGKLHISLNENKKLILIAGQHEYDRVKMLLEKTRLNFNFIGRVGEGNDSLGTIEQLEEILKIYKPDELIFCNNDISYRDTINQMEKLSSERLQFKTVPPESVFVIGSSSKNEPGDFYTFTDHFAINTPDNKLNKRLLDVVFSIFLFLTLPVSIWLVKHPWQYLKNIINVFSGKFSWVGYNSLKDNALPDISIGILNPADELPLFPDLDSATLHRLDEMYAREYSIYKDIAIIFKSFFKLGQKPQIK
jgi:hypothetical protein